MSLISGLLGGAIASLLASYLISKAEKSTLRKGELRYGKFILIIGVVCLGFVALTVYALFYDCDVWQKNSELFAVLGLVTFFGLGAIYSFAEYWLVRGHYDENKISFYTPWTGRKEECWDGLESLEFHPDMAWYIMRFKEGKTIRVSAYMGGHTGMLKILKKKQKADLFL